MSVKTIIQEAINKSPVALKEALEEELRARVALALEAKMKDEDEDEDEDEDDDFDEDEDEDEDKKNESVEQIDEISSKTLGKYINKASRDVAKKETERSKLRDQIQKHNFSDWDADAALGHDRETANKLRKARQDAADSMKAQDQKIFNKQWKRETGIHTAIKKLGQRD